MVIDRNMELVAQRGRDDQLRLVRQDKEIRLSDWAQEICANMFAICEQLDGDDATRPYSTVLRQQLEVVADPERTPSAMMLAEMRENGEGFFHFAQRLSLQHKRFFDAWRLNHARQQMLEQEASLSMEQQRIMQDTDEISFSRFLQQYFNQT